jgi:hypothetical protein
MAFSGHRLLPHLNVLQRQFLRGLDDDEERFRSTYFDLELLPYALGAAWHALSEFVRIQREILADFPPERLKGLAFVGLAPQRRDLLSHPFDNFIDATRRAQNAVIHYLSRGLRKSMPASMHKLVHAMQKEKITLPQLPQREILKYWEKHGQRLKEYRDLAQHHALVTSDARVVGSDDGRVGLYLLLPSNPEVKSAGKLSFGHPEVHASPYAKHEFKVLVAFLDWLTKGLITDPPELRSQIALNVFREPARLGPGVSYRAHVPPSAEKLEAEIREILDQLRVA